jgi:apolipoprotein N-acyltransferase
MNMFPAGTPVPAPTLGTVTIRPQAAAIEDPISTAKPSRRTALTSSTARAVVVSAVCAVALHLAFPRTGAWWLIPFALAGLFYLWSGSTPRTAALHGYLAGAIFFTLGFSWFGETAGSLLGPFAFVIPLGPAVVEALAFAFAALVASLAARRCSPVLAPAVAAAGFVVAEWARSSGLLAVPFGQLGLPLVEGPLRPLAAFAGGYALTLAAALLAAYAAAALRDRRTIPAFAIVAVLVVAATGTAWLAWPARHLAPPTVRVAAVQGNIRQELKATPGARILAVERYTAMTAALAPLHPAFVLWPETVILADMSSDAAARARFGALAHTLGADLGVGTLVRDPSGTEYENAVVYFTPAGTVGATVGKRQLVPFAEFLPGPSWMRRLPFTDEINDLVSGRGPQIDPTSGAGTLICWESVFGDLAAEQVRAGARFFAVATDDAWFGTTDGPYQHAEATTLRAVETGRWIVRAAATGISGIVAPDGDWRSRSGLETQETIVGEVGDPVAAPYSRYGPHPIGLGLAAFVALALLRRTRPAT